MAVIICRRLSPSVYFTNPHLLHKHRYCHLEGIKSTSEAGRQFVCLPHVSWRWWRHQNLLKGGLSPSSSGTDGKINISLTITTNKCASSCVCVCVCVCVWFPDIQTFPVPRWLLKMIAFCRIRLVMHVLVQRSSNCGPRTTSGPRILPLWSF